MPPFACFVSANVLINGNGINKLSGYVSPRLSRESESERERAKDRESAAVNFSSCSTYHVMTY